MIQWASKESGVLMNPRLPDIEKARAERLYSLGIEGHLWLSTSGTSGHFKWVALSKKGILASAAAVNRHLNSTACDVWLHALPDFHVGGIGIRARAELSNAQVINYAQKWEASAFHQAAHCCQATLTALVPTQIYDLVQGAFQAPGSLRATLVGGGALNRALYDKAQALGWNLLPTYGMTECASQIATAHHGIFGEGHVLDHMQVRVDSDQSIWINSPSLLTYYAVVDHDKVSLYDPKDSGWFKTEDKGELTGSALKVFGRGSDFVKINGESVNLLALQKIAEEIREEMGIRENVLIEAITHARMGYGVHLVIEGSTPLPHLIAAFNVRVMPYEKIIHTAFIEKFPRTHLGKVKRSVPDGMGSDGVVAKGSLR